VSRWLAIAAAWTVAEVACAIIVGAHLNRNQKRYPTATPKP
jgi:ABC-type tungstate transport system substrate-binding protein